MRGVENVNDRINFHITNWLNQAASYKDANSNNPRNPHTDLQDLKRLEMLKNEILGDCQNPSVKRAYEEILMNRYIIRSNQKSILGDMQQKYDRDEAIHLLDLIKHGTNEEDNKRIIKLKQGESGKGVKRVILS